jgi:hypothetical protein
MDNFYHDIPRFIDNSKNWKLENTEQVETRLASMNSLT